MMMNQNAALQRFCRRLKTAKWILDVKLHPGTGRAVPGNMLLFDTSIDSQNMGDLIIKHYCDLALSEITANSNVDRIPTHTLPSSGQMEVLSRAATKIVCGTNLMTPHFEEFSNWKMPKNLTGYRDIVTLGVGWGYYCEEISSVSRFVYRTILSRRKLLSVRDGYTEKKFREMGFTNVANTGCPTLWRLTAEHCATIPTQKAGRVITTLTDYDRDEQRDRRMIDLLKENYGEVFVWIQGTDDLEYLQSLVDVQTVRIIPRSLEAYTEALKMGDVDYVGSRLHAGIHAMNLGVRSIILAVDNRAIEMGRDFHLPVIRREELEVKMLPMIHSRWQTAVDLPTEKIAAWKRQFTVSLGG